jgi:hypothetical protein
VTPGHYARLERFWIEEGRDPTAELAQDFTPVRFGVVQTHHPLNPYFAKLCAKRGYKMATIAVAHRLCRIMFAMLRDKKDFDESKLGVERGPFERKSVRLYRIKAAKGVGK